MRPFPRFHTSLPGQVCRLKKSMYGVRQELRYYFFKQSTALRKYGFTQSYANYSLFIYFQHNVFLCVLVYVDGLLVTGNSLDSITKFNEYLSSCFHMKDLGPLKYFLGIKVALNPSGLYFQK